MFLGALVTGLCTGCATEGPYYNPPPARAPAVVPKLSLGSITAPIQRGGAAEVAELRTLPKIPAARLRVAWILLETGDADGAIAELNQLLYGSERFGAGTESFGYYIRSLAYERQGNPSRAAGDRDRAGELAIDEELRAAIQPRKAVVAKTPTRMPKALGTFLERDRWSARPARRSNLDPMGEVYRITIHHSDTASRGTNPNNVAAVIHSIQKVHQQQRGYGDIGYHLLVDSAGRVWKGRDLRYQGAHSGGANNKGNVGICLLGSFVARNQPTPAQLRTLEQLLQALCARYRVDPKHIYKHSDFKVTECPGVNLARQLPGIRARLRPLATR